MHLLDQSTVFAYCGTMLITNPATPFFHGECPDPTDEDSRRGFLASDNHCIFFYVRNHTWRVPVSAFLSVSAPTDFAQAERVIRFPLAATDGELLLGGIMSEPDGWRRFRLEIGDYSLYWVGYNIDKRWPTDEQMDLEDADYATLKDVERYDVVLVKGPCTGIEILKGSEYLYEKA